MTDPNRPNDYPANPGQAGEPVVSKPYVMPDEPEQGSVEALAKEAADARDKMLRTLAEMENLRKRTSREVADARVYGFEPGQVFGGLIDHRALDHFVALQGLRQSRWGNRLRVKVKTDFPRDRGQEVVQSRERNGGIRLAEFYAGAQFAHGVRSLLINGARSIGFSIEPRIVE